MTATSHTLRISKGSGGDAHYVMTQDATGRDCWFLVKITPRNLVRLKNTTREQRLDLTTYGDVLKSGWGHSPIANT